MTSASLSDGASWVSQDINSDEILVQKAVASYPLGASKNDKRVIRKNNTFLHVSKWQVNNVPLGQESES